MWDVLVCWDPHSLSCCFGRPVMWWCLVSVSYHVTMDSAWPVVWGCNELLASLCVCNMFSYWSSSMGTADADSQQHSMYVQYYTMWLFVWSCEVIIYLSFVSSSLFVIQCLEKPIKSSSFLYFGVLQTKGLDLHKLILCMRVLKQTVHWPYSYEHRTASWVYPPVHWWPCFLWVTVKTRTPNSDKVMYIITMTGSFNNVSHQSNKPALKRFVVALSTTLNTVVDVKM